MVEDVSVKPAARPVYLGDGCYASFDGYQIWLHVGAHDNPPVVALNQEVMANLNKYAYGGVHHREDLDV